MHCIQTSANLPVVTRPRFCAAKTGFSTSISARGGCQCGVARPPADFWTRHSSRRSPSGDDAEDAWSVLLGSTTAPWGTAPPSGGLGGGTGRVGAPRPCCAPRWASGGGARLSWASGGGWLRGSATRSSSTLPERAIVDVHPRAQRMRVTPSTWRASSWKMTSVWLSWPTVGESSAASMRSTAGFTTRHFAG
jgi:hypothetical protein|eukprot:COSAG06_NODE_1210_length_10251_cov_8.941588_5_plen_192_part_00